jgi:CubicO group peptidase (beta-lactamase class C family)
MDTGQGQLLRGLRESACTDKRILLAKGVRPRQCGTKCPGQAQSGSVGKQFVSAAIMMLVEQGQVSLDDSITSIFPTPIPRARPPSHFRTFTAKFRRRGVRIG